ncbi:hypothetical protein IHE61_00770 [Streptomyces sp. GKU 257-1]|nr:hypothetical protein [Streptomyces sp. GKU 257-1]
MPAHGRRQGWELAHWAVANAERLRIERISYGGFRWSAERSADGWRRTDDARGGGGRRRAPGRQRHEGPRREERRREGRRREGPRRRRGG